MSDVSVEFSYDGLADEIIFGGEKEFIYIDNNGNEFESDYVEGDQYNLNWQKTGPIHSDQVGEYNRHEECYVRTDGSSETDADQKSGSLSSTISTHSCGSRRSCNDSECDRQSNEIWEEKEKPGFNGTTEENKKNEITNS